MVRMDVGKHVCWTGILGRELKLTYRVHALVAEQNLLLCYA